MAGRRRDDGGWRLPSRGAPEPGDRAAEFFVGHFQVDRLLEMEAVRPLPLAIIGQRERTEIRLG